MDASTTTSPSLSHGDNDVGHEEENRSRPILRIMCRSCSECGRKKKSCDGNRPCGRCVRSGDRCTYSERRRYGERARMQRHRQYCPGRNGVTAKEVLLHSTTGALVTSGMLPFKRCRLSASPATGLVGMQENAFLSDFFGCVGFLPLTTPSHIRETMVKIMLPPASSQQSVFGDDCDEGGHYLEAVAPGGDLSKISAGNQLPMDPSACTFWCAVALGALVKGSPIESVTSYAELAQEALAKSSFGPGDTEVAKAWVILANLHGFMGDKERFEKYLALSDSFLRSSIEQGSTDMLPVGFAEIVKFRDIANVSCGTWQAESFPVQEHLAPPQLNEVATEAELYRYVSRSYSAFEKAIYTTVTELSASGTNGLWDFEPHGRPDGVHSSLEDFMAADISKAMRALLDDGGFVHFGPLQEAVDRPSVRAGIGVLLINGTYIVGTAAKGDLHAARERISRCIEVLEQYPGLCRCMIGCHMAHMMLTCLAAAGDSSDQAMYDRLRVISNSFRPPGSQPVPPFVEWRGVGAFCGDKSCRSIEGLVPSGHVTPFLEPHADDIDAYDATTPIGSGIDEDALHGRGHAQHEILPAFNNIPAKIIGTAPVWPTNNGGASDMGPLLVPTAPPTTSPTSSNHAFGQSDAGLHSVGAARGVTTPEPSLLGLPERSKRDGQPEDTGEDGIAEDDWLYAAHAISDAAETV